MKQKLLLAALVVGSIVFADVTTKRWALDALRPGHIIESAVGVPMTLAFNTGVAFGLPLPSAGRWIIIFATLLVLFVLGSLIMAYNLWRTARGDVREEAPMRNVAPLHAA